MQRVSDCFQESVSLKINPSYNKKMAPHVISLVFKKASAGLQYALTSLRQEMRNRRIELFLYEGEDAIGISLVCKEESISIKSNMLAYNTAKLNCLVKDAEHNEKIILAFYCLTRDNRMCIIHDQAGEPIFLPVYFSSGMNGMRMRAEVNVQIAEELSSFIFDHHQWRN